MKSPYRFRPEPLPSLACLGSPLHDGLRALSLYRQLNASGLYCLLNSRCRRTITDVDMVKQVIIVPFISDTSLLPSEFINCYEEQTHPNENVRKVVNNTPFVHFQTKTYGTIARLSIKK